jgi:hypothetical protein
MGWHGNLSWDSSLSEEEMLEEEMRALTDDRFLDPSEVANEPDWVISLDPSFA